MRGKSNLLPRVVSVALAAVLLVTGLSFSMRTEEEKVDVVMPLAYSAGGIEMCDHSIEIPIITKQATATEPGEVEYKCVSCGMLLREEIIPVRIKRERPLSVINTEKCTLFNIPENSIVSVNGKVISFSANGSLDLAGEFANPGDYVITVIANETELAASDPQAIYIFKPAAPGDVQTLPANGDNNGLIAGVGPFMEYKAVDSDTWSICVGPTQPLPAGVYKVRLRATATSVASEPYEVVVGQEGQVTKQVTPGKETVEENAPLDKNNVPVVKKQSNNAKKNNNTVDKKDEQKEEKPEKAEEKETPVKEEVKKPEIVVDNIFTKDDDEPIAATGEKGWYEIRSKIENANGLVVISLAEDTLVPAEVFVKAAEVEVPLVFIVKDEIVWNVEPSDIDIEQVRKNAKINLGLDEKAKNVPDAAYKSVESIMNSQVINKTFDIMHNGDFGFITKLTMKLKDVVPGEYANLFTYNRYAGDVRYVASSEIDEDNKATFEMTHASSYFIVTSKLPMNQGSVQEIVAAEEEETTDVIINETAKHVRKISPVKVGLIIIVLAAIIVLTVVLLNKKDNDFNNPFTRK